MSGRGFLNLIGGSTSLSLSGGLLVLRVSTGLLLAINHGWGKAVRFMSGEEIKFYNFAGSGAQASLGMAAFAELVCSLLIVLGLFHRLATLPLIMTFIVAAFGAKSGEPLLEREPALMFLVVFITLFLTGPGKYSIDAARKW